EYKPNREIFAQMLTPDKAIDRGVGFADTEALKKQYDAYVDTLDLIKDAQQLYIDALQRYISQVDKEHGIGTAAVENIVYDLGISGTVLFRGVTNKDGRSAAQILDMTLALRELLFSGDKRVSDGMRAQAAEYLAALFKDHLHFGLAREQMDLGGGLSVPPEVYDLNLGKQNLAILKEEEAKAFLVFWPNLQTQTLHGHSLTAMDWLVNFYRKLSKQYYERHVGDALKLDAERLRPELMEAVAGLSKLKTWEEMMDYYKGHFRTAGSEFLNGGPYEGMVVSVPPRIEDSAGGIGDSTFLSTFRPHLYRILNHAGLLSREDGTVGRNVEVTFDIVDRKDLPKAKDALGNTIDAETFLSVHSLDIGWIETVTNARDALKKTKADLVLQTLVSLGFLPKSLMDKAIEEGKTVQTLGQVFDHVLGTGKGLAITVHVRGITAGSGLAVSSGIAMGTATAFDVLLGAKLVNPPMRQRVTRLKLGVDGPGFYYVEFARQGQFDDPSKTYRFPRRAVDGKVEVDLIPEEMPAGDGQYSVRLRRIQDDIEDIRQLQEGQWVDHEGTQWTLRGNITLDSRLSNTEEVLKEGFNHVVEIERFDRVYDMMDDEFSIGRAMIGSQTTVLRLGQKAGTQDEVMGLGGMVLTFAGDPIEGDIIDEDTGELRHVKFAGGVVPRMVRVPLSQQAIDLINRAMRIIRIGMSEPAEDTLDAVYSSSMLNETRDAQNVWAELTLQMLMGAQRADIEAMGNADYQGVSLRQKSAPVSIHPDVLGVLEDFVYHYGQSHGLRYGISGARASGSDKTYFTRKDLSPEDIDQRMTELEQEMLAARKRRGKIGPNEDDPRAFKHSKIAQRGTAVHKLTPAEMRQYREGVLKGQEAYKEAQRRTDQKRVALYSEQEMVELKQKYHLNTPLVQSPAMKDPKSVLTMEEELAAKAEELMARHPGQGLTMQETKEMQQYAQSMFPHHFQKVVTPGANSKERALIRQRLMHSSAIIAQASLNAAQTRLLLAAAAQGIVNLLWNFQSPQEITAMAQALDQGHDLDATRYQEEFAHFDRQLQEAQKRFDALCAAGGCLGLAHFSPAFYQDLAAEIAEKNAGITALKAQLQTNRRSSDAEIRRYHQDRKAMEDLELIARVISLEPSPEEFNYGHFIYEASSTYRKYFGTRMDLLNEAVAQGALVDYPLYGGTGARAWGGKVKGVVPFQAGDESNMTLLKGAIRNWAAFLKRFPSKRKAFINLMVSAFTEDAIKAVLNGYLKETGLDIRAAKLTPQSMREVVRPTELELMLNLALQSTATPAEYEELKRVYD
ncbi:MAG: hypothetical protein HY591_02855, partial [Candidatus Omnitrophica bacterium]|nr:hypothetical protein [Candidatus Omnitrophota bacterium]